MKVTDLQKYEPSLKLMKGSYQDATVDSISHVESPLPETFIFIKKKKFLKSLGQESAEKDFPDVGVLFEQALYQELGDDIFSRFRWVGTVENVDHAMSRLSKPFYEKKFGGLNYHVDGRQLNNAQIDPEAEIAQNVFIGENCKIGAHVTIMPGAVIMPEVIIEEGTVIFPNVTIYPYCHIGAFNRIHAGTVIGTDGFGYNFFEGEHQKVWHIGGVRTDRNVEIGCNTMIDAGTFSPTTIGEGSKIDNDVQLSHNTKIHKHVVICGMTGLAGSVEVHDYCAFGAQSGVAPAAILEQGVQVAARAAVSENARVPAGTVMAGHPARPLRQWLKMQANIKRLDKK